MPAGITVEPEHGGDNIHLGETFIPDDPETLGSGEATSALLTNSGTTMLREVTVAVEGDSANCTQLAIDVEGEPGQWADVNESIIFEGTIKPGDSVRLWARPCYSPGDAEGELDGHLRIRAISA